MNYKQILITVAITLVIIKLLNSFAPTALNAFAPTASQTYDNSEGDYDGEEYA